MPYPQYYPMQTQPYTYNQPMDQLGQLRAQQYQQQMVPTQMSGVYQQPAIQQTVGINGKFVQSVDGITANDVPMDGSAAIFPKQDMSEIYAKSWNADGTIRTIVFKPVLDGQTDNSKHETKELKLGLSDDATAVFMERFDDVIDRIAKLEKSIKMPVRKNRDEAKA